ncbi:sensor domain-containing diguanylate cyclase [Dechloromonas agitata]|uniref:sensor domain-containing diguanylate cyclase n=1 Tax=Dechloromonas agitata TaxID=73030 RepID=UPI0004B26092|nr:sensor domain-containing diguanylate cyclase [Dechloromonas agitata]
MRPESEGDGIALSQLVEGNPVATIVIDARHRVTHWNRACAVLTGVPAADMIGRSEQWRAFYDSARPIMADLVVDGVLEAGIDLYYHGKFSRSLLIDDAYEAEDFFPAFGDGGRWLFFTAAALRNARGEVIGAIETLQDVTERRKAEAALREKEACLAQIVEGSSVPTMVIDAQHCVSHWNKACEALTGTSALDVIGTGNHWKSFYANKRPMMADLIVDAAGEREIDRLYHGRYRPSPLISGAYEAEDFYPNVGEGGRWLFFTAAPLRNANGEVIGAIETLQDVTERRRAEEALRESEERYRSLSQTDSLTALYNSRHLHECLPAEIERAKRYQRPLSLLVLDCDNFKAVNDNYGHLGGDRVLQNLAHAIRQCLRRSDLAFRYGGEEFVVALPETDAPAALAIAERLRALFAAVRTPAPGGEAIRCTVSIGIAVCQAGDEEGGLIRRADEACYRAKQAGKNRVILADSVR